MPYAEIDLSTASPLFGATWDGTAIIAAPGAGPDPGFIVPGLEFDQTKTYRFEFDVTAPGPGGAQIRLFSLRPDEDLGTSNFFDLGPVLNMPFPPNSESRTVDVGPGIEGWDDATAVGESHLYFDISDVEITGLRWTETVVAFSDWFQEDDFIYEQPPEDTDGWLQEQVVRSEDHTGLPGPPYPPLDFDLMAANVGDVAWPSSSGVWGGGGIAVYQPTGPLGGTASYSEAAGTNRYAVAQGTRFAFPYAFTPHGGLTPLDPTTDPDPAFILDEREFPEGREWEQDHVTIESMVLRLPYHQINWDGTILGANQVPNNDPNDGVGGSFETKLLAIPMIEFSGFDIVDFDGATHAFGPVFGSISGGTHGATSEELFPVYGGGAPDDLLVSEDPEHVDYGKFAYCTHVNLFGGNPTVAGAQEGTIAMGMGPTSSGGEFEHRMIYQMGQPRYRYRYLVPTEPPSFGAAPPVLRVYPRTDGLGASTTPRIWPPPRSRQRSNRATGYL